MPNYLVKVTDGSEKETVLHVGGNFDARGAVDHCSKTLKLKVLGVTDTEGKEINLAPEEKAKE